jgi:hypothetical protein
LTSAAVDWHNKTRLLMTIEARFFHALRQFDSGIAVGTGDLARANRRGILSVVRCPMKLCNGTSGSAYRFLVLLLAQPETHTPKCCSMGLFANHD